MPYRQNNKTEWRSGSYCDEKENTTDIKNHERKKVRLKSQIKDEKLLHKIRLVEKNKQDPDVF